MKKNATIIHIDMDDTICNFSRAWYRDMISFPNNPWPQSREAFFLGLTPIEDAIEKVNMLRQEFEVYILTRPSVMNPLCYTEKRLWIERHFDMPLCERLIICPDKALIRGDVLIDDMPWPGFQGEQVLFGSHQFPTWAETYNHIIEKYRA